MGAGVHTSRVVRNTKRIGEAFGLDVKLSVFHRNIILTIIDKETNEACNEVIDIPAHPISFEHNSELSALSWEAVDNHLSLEELKDKYKKIISAPRIHPLFVLLLVGFANASFCKLFGGDLISMGIVFSATITGFYLKQQMQAKKINHYVVFIVSAFVASLCASTALIFDTTSEIAMATSVLYLVPGVPLINGVIDVVEGYVLTGFARLTEASLLIVSIADILTDGFFAAVAGIGFGAISDPPLRAFKMIAILAALGHACRFCLMNYLGMDIATGSLFAGLVIGFGSLWLGKKVYCPMTVLYIPALLPMIPGKFAYNMVFSLIMCLQNVNDPDKLDKFMSMFFSNTLIASTVIFMLAVGATFPMFLFPHRAFSLTRH